MKQVTLKFLGTGYSGLCQAFVTICDINGNVIWKGYTCNGRIKICLKTNCYYRVCASLNSNIINKTFYVDRRNVYIFIFDFAIINTMQNPVTFFLTDENYLNLPIQKGEVIVWQNQLQ